MHTLPNEYEDITERKPANECTKADIEGLYFNKVNGEIGRAKVYHQEGKFKIVDLEVLTGERRSLEFVFYEWCDDLFPGQNHLKIRKRKTNERDI